MLALAISLLSTGEIRENIPYRPALGDAYIEERCRLDLWLPEGSSSYPLVVWLHGGGLEGGSKSIPEELKNQGVAVAAPNYRLTPRVKASVCIEDAAAAVAWIIKDLGVPPERIILSGHSAGGYLASMIGLDKRWLTPYGIDPNAFAGIAPFSGHTITHFARRKELGMADTQPLVDDMAPLTYVRKDAPPMLLLTGDREKELLGRYEEVAYFWRMLQVVGHPNAKLIELPDVNHGEMVAPGMPHLLRFVRERIPTSR
jgi:acetyl esterase/lipase